MGDRVDRNQSQTIDRAIQIRAREIQKKQVTQDFQTKLATNQQLGANARVQVGSQVLEQMAQGEEAAKAPASEQTSEAPVAQKALPQEKSKKTEQKTTQKNSEQGKQVEKKKENVTLDLAVQRKNQQQDQDSGAFGGSSGGDFFQQAISMGMATQKAEAVPGGPVKIPDEILNQIVDQVHAGVDAQGVSLFVIDLKPGVLGGGRIQISAQGKKIKLKFSGLDAVSRRQVKSDKGELRDRLEAKGLELESLEAT